MLRLIVVAVFVACAAATLDRDREWRNFMTLYNKKYLLGEERYRRVVWEKNMDYIIQHNLEADRGLHSYRLGENEYIDMTGEEFVKTMNGLLVNVTSHGGSSFLPPENVELPSEVDWRTKGYVTPIKNQGMCGSCWAFSSTGSLEGQHFKATGKLVSLSEQNLVDCSKKEGNHGCGGGWMDYAFQYVKDNKGIDTEASYQYIGRDEPCHFKKSTIGATDKGFTDIKQYSEDALQQAVATVGPISVAIDASRPSFRMYKSGVYNEPTCSQTRLDHGVLAVGYGTEGSDDYWIVKNSWGETWGDKGYIKMSRNKNNQCGIATKASYPNV